MKYARFLNLLAGLALGAAAACSPSPPSDSGALGATACAGEQQYCGGSCVTVASSSAHCGRCGNHCPSGTVCSDGACQLECGPGLSSCADDCVSPISDSDHCGGCGQDCGDGFVCQAGACTCPNPAGCQSPNLGSGGSSASGGSGGAEATGGSSGISLDPGSEVLQKTTATAPATFSVEASISPAIATVGIVTFSLDKTITSARIEFGRAPDQPEYNAPVDLSSPGYRTALLGMKPGTAYTWRVVAEGDGQVYVSEDKTLTTGYLPNALPALNVVDTNRAGLYGAFTVACNGVGNGAPGPGQTARPSFAFIIDRDGDYVWAYELTSSPATECTRARLSHDGKHLWAGSFGNTTQMVKGGLRRVSMDGLEFMDYSEDPTSATNIQVVNLSRRHHDFSILGNGNLLYQERKSLTNDMTPDTIRELNIQTGESTQIYDTELDFGTAGSHMNYVTWIPSLNAVSGSMRHLNAIVLVSYPSGQVLGIFSGDQDQFGVGWEAQHGHHFSNGKLLVFNNTNGGNANVLEFPFDLTTKTAGPVDTFPNNYASLAFGDVRRLPNGNTFITYSNVGHFVEIDAAHNVLRDIATDPVGYAEHRKTLYGPPPHFSD